MLLPFNLFTGKEADRAQLHFANPAMWGACNWRVGSSGDPMTIQHDGHYRSYRRQRGRSLTADYDDAVSDLDMQYGCQAVLMADQEHFLGLAIMRGRMEGPCDSSALFARNLYNFLSAFWDKEAAKPVLPDDDEIVKALRVAPALEMAS